MENRLPAINDAGSCWLRASLIRGVADSLYLLYGESVRANSYHLRYFSFVLAGICCPQRTTVSWSWASRWLSWAARSSTWRRTSGRRTRSSLPGQPPPPSCVLAWLCFGSVTSLYRSDMFVCIYPDPCSLSLFPCIRRTSSTVLTRKRRLETVLWFRIRIRKIHMFLGLLDSDPDPLVTGTDPSIT